jgi:cardiolipin synthase A/B
METGVMNLSWPLVFSQVFLLIGVLLGVILVLRILLQRNTPQVTIAWLLAILFLPYIGVPLYLFLGGRKVRRATAKKHPLDFTCVALSPSDGTEPIRRLLEAYAIPAPCMNNHLEVLNTGEQAYERLLQLIDQAHTSIHIAIYVFDKDPVAETIRDHLTRKAREGVQIRVLLDGVGSLHTHRRFFSTLLQAQGQVAYFMPLLHRPFRGRTNLRNHRKIVLIDDVTVWTGGRNIGAEYMGPAAAPHRWRDISFILRGSAVVHYQDVFRADWEFAYGDRLESTWIEHASDPSPCPGQGIVQVVPSGPDLPHDALYDAIVSMAFAAQERLWIVSPYFVPDHALSQALAIAARRGIDVRIIVPAESNYTLVDLVRGRYLRDLQRAGAKILLYTPGMMHAKLLLKDQDLAMIGSANMDIRSLFLDYEIAAFFYDANSIRAVESWVEETLPHCRVGVDEVSMLRSLFEAIVQVIAPVV